MGNACIIQSQITFTGHVPQRQIETEEEETSKRNCFSKAKGKKKFAGESE